MKTVIQITVELAKGREMLTLWRITRRRPCPSPDHGGRWENGGDAISRYGKEASGKLPDVYRVELLRSDYDAATAEGNRADCAGYAEGYGEKRKVAPGTIVYRGRDLGEMCGELRIGGDGVYAVSPYMSWDDAQPDGVRNWLNGAIVPGLVAGVVEHHAALTREALDGLRAGMAEYVAQHRRYADQLERDAAKAMELAERVNA